MERSVSMPLGVVVERRALASRWARWSWRPVAVIPGAGAADGWRELAAGEGWTRFHAATLPLTLHRKETEAYRTNLASAPPRVYVVLREAERADAAWPVRAVLVTASPYEAQDYLDNGEDVVEGVAMPDGVIAWTQAFVDRHHVEEPFRKRRRRDVVEDEALFARDDRFGAPPGRGGNGFG